MRRLMTLVLSKRAYTAMEAESREWMMVCPCGHRISVWDAGGIRYKAAGEPRHRRRCSSCGEATWHKVTKSP